MKILKELSIAALLATSLAAAPAALAVTVSPAGAPFTAVGSTVLKQGILTVGCTATFVGKVSDNGSSAQVTSASFSGGLLCQTIQATGFPWTITPPSTTSAVVTGIQVQSSVGHCGPSTINAGWNNTSSALTFSDASLSGGCTVSGTLTTTPKLTFH